MKLNWNLKGGGRVQKKQPSLRGSILWIFCGTAVHYITKGTGHSKFVQTEFTLSRVGRGRVIKDTLYFMNITKISVDTEISSQQELAFLNKQEK